MKRLSFDCQLRYPSGFLLSAAFQTDSGVTAICGPSGCGKTTVLSLIAGLLRPTQGRISFGDRVLVDADQGVWAPVHRRGIGYLFQDQRLFPHLTVKGNLTFPQRRMPRLRRRQASRTLFSRVVEELDIGPLLHRYPHSLSGGQKQRVALGRAILCEGELLLLDEPWQGLDAELQQRSLTLLRETAAAAGASILFVSHHAEDVERYAGQVVKLSQGRIDSP